MGRRHVVGVCRCTATHDLTNDVGTARLRMFEGLKHQGSSTFTEHKAIPVDVKWRESHTGSSFRVDSAFMAPKPPMPASTTAASAPPLTMASALPYRWR